MGIFDLFGGGDTIQKRGDAAFAAASLCAIELCQHGSIAQVPGAIGVKDSAATMCVSSALLHAAMFCASFDYIAEHNCQVPRDEYQKLFNAIKQAGGATFNGEFGRVWSFSNQCIHSHDAEQRIMGDAHGDPVSLRMSAIVECVNWALQALNRGVPSSLMTRNMQAFIRIVQNFDAFCMRISPELKF